MKKLFVLVVVIVFIASLTLSVFAGNSVKMGICPSCGQNGCLFECSQTLVPGSGTWTTHRYGFLWLNTCSVYTNKFYTTYNCPWCLKSSTTYNPHNELRQHINCGAANENLCPY